MSDSGHEPRVGDLVQVFLSGIPSVGVIFSIDGEKVTVRGSRWEGVFSKEEIRRLPPGDEREE